MKSVPLKTLKENLASIVEEASQGTTIEVTKYNKPLIYLVPTASQSLHQGESFGQESLKPALKNAVQGQWLKSLLEDREDS